MSELVEKLEQRSARVVVSGAGYVGLPLSLELARAGYRVTALDPDRDKIQAIEQGKSYVEGVSDRTLGEVVESGRLQGTTEPGVLEVADVVAICVPTPLNHAREPDIRHITAAVDDIVRYQHAGMLVVLESTTYPGTTGEVLVPRLGARFRVGEEVFIAYSPQRADPGNTEHGLRNTPKVVSGATPACLRAAMALYGSIVDQLVAVSSTTTAELVKLLENTFRSVNVGLANEFAMISRKFGVDPFEVVHAAATKPFGFMPFLPGPGVGGHCIAVDPLYLSWKAAQLGTSTRFTALADDVNRAMPAYVVSRVAEALGESTRTLRGAKVLVYGVTYKRDVADIREAPALRVIEGLTREGALVAYMDPLIDKVSVDGTELRSVDPASSFAGYDVVVVVTDHRSLDRARLLREAPLIVDTRNALAFVEGPRAHVRGL